MKAEAYSLAFPQKGLVEGAAYVAQPANTTARAQNVRVFEPNTDRARGGKRCGLSKYCPTQINSDNDVQDIIHVVTSSGGSTNQALSVRTTSAYAVAGGTVAKFTSSGTSAVTGGNVLSSTAPVIFSADMFGVIYYVDGAAFKKLTVSTDTMTAWTASAGALPTSGSYVPRLICLWNGRIVLSGLRGDEHNWFMSKVNDATDWDYSPATVTEQVAVAGNTSLLGKIGDVITCLVPYSDDLLIFGCDHSIWQLTGDPAAGGRFDRLSDSVGMAWGRCFCKDPYGRIYFFGAQGGVYRLTPGSPPERISAWAIENKLRSLDLNTHLIRMAWSDQEQGVYVFVTPLIDGNVANNFLWDVRTESWWLDVYDNSDHYPRTVYEFDGDAPGDRVVLLGGKDGYIRKIDMDAEDDDGTAIESFVFLGPIRPRGKQNEMVIDQIDAILGLATIGTDTQMRVWVGDDEEDALGGYETELEGLLTEAGEILIGEEQSGTAWSANLVAGSNVTHHPRRRGFVGYIEINNSAQYGRWSLERVDVRLRTLGLKQR